jgi:nucleotide-binding universal stress UspA family protein
MSVISTHQPEHAPNAASRLAGDRVLACIDDGPGGRAAARVADVLASVTGARLLLATVLPCVAPGPGAAGHSPALVRGGRALLASAERECAQPTEMRVAFGEPAERLIALAERELCQLAVVCAPGPAPLSAPLLGSAYLALAGAGPCPVVIVPRGLGVFPTGNGPIVCGIDGSGSSLAATGVAADLAASFGTRLHCVQVADDDPARRLAAIAARERALIIVVGARGQGAPASALLGSTSSRLAANTSRPVAIAPSPAVT